jgi:predicted DNA-binding protein
MATIQVAIRIPEELAARVDALAAALSQRAAGTPITRSDAARLAMERGAAALEVELAIGEKPRKGGKRAAKGA